LAGLRDGGMPELMTAIAHQAVQIVSNFGGARPSWISVLKITPFQTWYPRAQQANLGAKSRRLRVKIHAGTRRITVRALLPLP
jgi:hypothetical protein